MPYLKIKLLLCCTVLLFSSTALAESLLVEGKVSAFRPSAEILRQIYSPTWANFYLEASSPLNFRKLYVWASVNYTDNKGYSIGEETPTRIYILPVSLGLKHLQPLFTRCKFYSAIGEQYVFLRINNDFAECILRKVRKSDWGGVLKGGILYNITPHLFLDFFADFSFCYMHFSKQPEGVVRNNLEVGGISAGAGVGFSF